MPFQEATVRLQGLIHRQDQVTMVLHPPSASLARVMEAAGAEAGFDGTAVWWGLIPGWRTWERRP